MLGSLFGALAGAFEAIKAWFARAERAELRKAGRNEQKIAELEARERARAEKMARDERLRHDPDLASRLRDSFDTGER